MTIERQEIYTRLYVAFLKSCIYDDIAFEDTATELTLGTIVNEQRPTVRQGNANLEVAEGTVHDSCIFQEDEILVYGMPERRQLSAAATKRLRQEVDTTLQTIAELFYAGSTMEDVGSRPPISRLPEDLQDLGRDIDSMQVELNTLSRRLTELLGQTRTTREEFDHELEQLICNTFPAYEASRSASIDLLAATLEAALQKLNSIRENARQAFYNHQVEQSAMNTTETVSRAISTAYQALVKEEEVLKVEAHNLDRQIEEYEALLRLVDGSGGYQQIVKDWVKVKRETEECLKDLRRLGWTGD